MLVHAREEQQKWNSLGVEWMTVHGPRNHKLFACIANEHDLVCEWFPSKPWPN